MLKLPSRFSVRDDVVERLERRELLKENLKSVQWVTCTSDGGSAHFGSGFVDRHIVMFRR